MAQQLVVNTRELVAALKQLKVGVTRNASQKASLTYSDGCLEIALRGAAVRLNAEGHWRGTAHVAVQPLATLISVPPRNEQVTISYADGRVRLGTMRFLAEWQDVGPPQPSYRSMLHCLITWR